MRIPRLLTLDVFAHREIISFSIIGYRLSKDQERSLPTSALVVSVIVGLSLIIMGIYGAYTDNHIILITFAGLMLASVVAGVLIEWFTLAESTCDILASVLSTIQFALLVTNNQ